MIRSHYDHRVRHPARAFEIGEQPAHLIVALLDETHIGRDRLASDLVARKPTRDQALHEGAIDRMGIAPFALVATEGLNVSLVVHRMIGRGNDIGPVRLDIGEMAEPGRFRVPPALEPTYRLRGQPRGLRILLADVGGAGGVLHQPARRQRPLRIEAGIGAGVPGVVFAVALAPQIFVVGRAAGIVESVRSLRPEAVVTQHDIEAAFGEARADDGIRSDAQSLEPFDVGRHMGLSNQPGLHPDGAKMVAERLLPNLQRKVVALSAVAMDVASRVETHARRTADWRLHVSSRETHALAGERVDMRRLQMRMTGATQIIEAQLVEHDEENVLASVRHGLDLLAFTARGADTGPCIPGAVRDRASATDRWLPTSRRP